MFTIALNLSPSTRETYKGSIKTSLHSQLISFLAAHFFHLVFLLFPFSFFSSSAIFLFIFLSFFSCSLPPSSFLLQLFPSSLFLPSLFYFPSSFFFTFFLLSFSICFLCCKNLVYLTLPVHCLRNQGGQAPLLPLSLIHVAASCSGKPRASRVTWVPS